jgi:TolB-like protein/Tfp pilus assembly protein PilF
VEPGAPSLFQELKRRRVFRALVGYGIAAFAVLQIIEPIMHGLHWPEAVLSYVVAALALGFPIVVSLAWIFDVNQGRIERAAPAPRLRGARLALVLVVIGLLAAVPGTFWYFYVRGVHRPASERPAPSIAVLPFVNLSSDKEQEYFSDGIAEEILNALAQIQGLRVIGRTSSFSLKGKGEDLRAIGEKLDAANLLEGSVRKSGSRVRITAQLIEASGGSNLWSQQFDRELTDVFAVQDEIAKAVVEALKLKLLPAQAAAIDEQRTASPEAHDMYLWGRHFYDRGSVEGYDRALQALEKAVALDPGYAPAWAALSLAHYSAYDHRDPTRHDTAQAIPRARAAAEKAIVLAPRFAGGYSARGNLRVSLDYDWSGARADLERALSLNPGDAGVLISYAWLLGTLGKLPEAIAAGRKAVALDPLSSEGWTQLSAHYLGTGELDLAEGAAQRALDVSPEQAWAARNLGFAYLLQGRPAEARVSFQRSRSDFFRVMGEALVEYQLGHGAEAQRALAQMLTAPGATAGNYQIAQVYAWRGEADGAFEWLESAYRNHDGGLGFLKYDPLLRKVRGDARYAALLRKMNLPPD